MTAGGREDDGCHAPFTSLVLLDGAVEFSRERIHDPRAAISLVRASDSIVFNSTPNERPAPCDVN